MSACLQDWYPVQVVCGYSVLEIGKCLFFFCNMVCFFFYHLICSILDDATLSQRCYFLGYSSFLCKTFQMHF